MDSSSFGDTKVQPSLERLTSELQPPELKGDQAVADLNEMHQRVQVVGGQDEAIPGAEVPPSAQQEVPAQTVLQGAGEVFVKDGVQVVVIGAWREKGEADF